MDVAPHVLPWKEPMNAITELLFVYAIAIFKALSVASAPPFVKKIDVNPSGVTPANFVASVSVDS